MMRIGSLETCLKDQVITFLFFEDEEDFQCTFSAMSQVMISSQGQRVQMKLLKSNELNAFEEGKKEEAL